MAAKSIMKINTNADLNSPEGMVGNDQRFYSTIAFILLCDINYELMNYIRFTKFNGGFSQDQLTWLRAQLQDATRLLVNDLKCVLC